MFSTSRQADEGRKKGWLVGWGKAILMRPEHLRLAQKAERKGEVRLTRISNKGKGVWTSLAIRDQWFHWLVELQHERHSFEDLVVRNAFGCTNHGGLNTSVGCFSI